MKAGREMFSLTFEMPPPGLKLGPDEIHIWIGLLDQPVSRLQRLAETLSGEERIKADHFHFDKDRRYFTARRGILRTILGSYLNADPSLLTFRYGRNRKPELKDGFGKGRIHFNLSHSEGVSVFAFARDHEIGVDIEQVRDISGMKQIVERFFSIRENELFRSLGENQKKEAFFKGWTCKEAFIKAIGEGLFRPLDQFDVSLFPGEPTKLLRIDGDAGEARRWSIQELKPAPNCLGAFAVKTHRYETRCWRWEGR